MEKAGMGLENSSWGTPASVEFHRPEGGGQQERIWVGMVFKNWSEEDW